MPDTVGFAIIGCGNIAEIHARAIGDVPGARLAAVYSRTRSKAERIAALGRETFVGGDLDSTVSRSDVDVVVVATPSGAHLEPALAAAAAGKHLLIEKPIEITVERVDRILDAARRAGVRVGAVFQSRFGRGARALKDAVDAGRFGRITLADAYVKWFRPQSYYDGGDWRGTRRWDGGGAIMNQSIHAVDLLQWLVGMPDRIMAFAAALAHERIEVEDTAVAVLRFPGGALGVLEGATSSYPGWAKRIEISGDEGSVILEDDRILAWDFLRASPQDETIRRTSETDAIGGGASDPMAIDIEGHRRQIEDMVGVARENREPRIPGAEGRNAVLLIESLYRSAEEGRPVEIPRKESGAGDRSAS